MKVAKVLRAIREELKQPLPEPRVVSTTNKRKRKMAKKAKKAVEDEELDEDLEEEEGSDDEDEEEAPKSKKKDKKSKKSKKAKDDEDDDEGYVTVEDLAEEAEIGAQAARVKLRDAELEKPEGGRWRWKDGSKGLKEARKVLGL
jgi:hypothetical protein